MQNKLFVQIVFNLLNVCDEDMKRASAEQIFWKIETVPLVFLFIVGITLCALVYFLNSLIELI